MVGRKEEIKLLLKAYESQYSEFVTVYGRRRIGKTFLVSEFFGGKFAFHVAGVKGGKKREQLDKFRYALIRHGAEKCPRLTSWLHAFHELEMFLESFPEGRKVLFFDEMPWMDTHGSGFLSALESFWNEWASCRKDILLIACGSATSWIVKKINHNAGGLYNRVRTQIKLYPFTLAECEAYAAELGLSYSRTHIAECYMAFGGVAYYWSLLEKGKSPDQNFNQLFFGRRDGLRLEFEELYTSLFTNPAPYIDIILALGKRRSGLSRDELAEAIGGTSNGNLSQHLADLEECGFIRKYRPVGGVNGGFYQLVDNFSLFYMRFVKDCPSRDGDHWTDGVSEGEKNEWRGFAFERLCLEHVPQIKAALGIAGVHADVYSWKCSASLELRGAQIDLLLVRRDGIVNLCEMKYSKDLYAIDADEDRKIARRVAAFDKEFGGKKTIHVTLVTSHGLAHNTYWNNVQSEVTLDDLFQDVRR